MTKPALGPPAAPPLSVEPQASGPALPGAGEYAFDAFISYSWADKSTAHALYERLVKKGLRIWLDDKQVLLGESIPDALAKGLERSRHLIVLLSKASLASRYASLERQVGIESDPDARRLVLLPVVLEDDLGPLPPLLRHRRSVRLRDASGLEEVVSEIERAIRGLEATPTPEPPAPLPVPPTPLPVPPESKTPPLLRRSGVAAIVLGLVFATIVAVNKRPSGSEGGRGEATNAATSGPAQPASAAPATTATPPDPGATASASAGVPGRDPGHEGRQGKTEATGPRPSGPHRPAPHASDPGAGAKAGPLGTAPSTAVAPNAFATAGAATCNGLTCTLVFGGRSLPPKTERVYLKDERPEGKVYGVRPSCLVEGDGPTCRRDDKVATVALDGTITWSLKLPRFSLSSLTWRLPQTPPNA